MEEVNNAIDKVRDQLPILPFDSDTDTQTKGFRQSVDGQGTHIFPSWPCLDTEHGGELTVRPDQAIVDLNASEPDDKRRICGLAAVTTKNR